MSAHVPRTSGNPRETLPVHRAIDYLTTAMLEAQRLRNRLREGEAVTADHLAILATIDARLHDLGQVLTVVRDDPTSSGDPPS